MGLQMQEYAVSQVLHWFRRFDDYQALKSRPGGNRCQNISRRFYHRHPGGGCIGRKSGRKPASMGIPAALLEPFA
jgi:glyoxylate/hydroxypyruvate reductase A